MISLNTLGNKKKYYNLCVNTGVFNGRLFSEKIDNVEKRKINLLLHLVTNSKYSESVGSIYLKVKRFIEGGGKIVQIRFQEEEVRDHVELAKRLAQNMPLWDPESKLLINDRPDVAWISGAQGVHLGPLDIFPDDAKKLLGPDSIIGYTVNSLEDVLFANDNENIDYIGVQIYPSKLSRIHSPKIWGEEFAKVISISTKPVVFIGGITLKNLTDVLPYMRLGDGIAIGGEILKEDDPWGTTQKIQALIDLHTEKLKNRE